MKLAHAQPIFNSTDRWKIKCLLPCSESSQDLSSVQEPPARFPKIIKPRNIFLVVGWSCPGPLQALPALPALLWACPLP